MAAASPTVTAFRPVSVDATVAGHRRDGGSRKRSRLRSVRVQLLVPIAVAVLGLTVLGTAQTVAAIGSARDAHRAQVLAGTATATIGVVHELERELAETVALRLRGASNGPQLVTAQRARTDTAIGALRAASNRARATAPGLGAVLDTADRAIAQLADVRRRGISPGVNRTTSDTEYQALAAGLLGIADALATQLNDPRLVQIAREAASVAWIEHYAALERDLLRSVFARGDFETGELARLAGFEDARQQREAEFERVSNVLARVRYDTQVSGPDVNAASRMRDGAFNFQTDRTVLAVDPDAWYVAQSAVIRRVDLVGLGLTDNLQAVSSDIATTAARRAWVTAVGTGGVALLAIAAALLFAVRTSRRLRRLRAATITVARHELPGAITAVSAGLPPDAAMQRASPAAAATRSIASSADEVGELADAFTVVHGTALRLAAQQAELRVDVTQMAEVLARRIRTLITRQIRLLDEFERSETDPDALARLFALDHLAARLRRNGENLLVLAGGEPTRPQTEAYPLSAVVAAAASEIEDFHRIDTVLPEIAVAGTVVGDLVHLLAELLENAASFSPPVAPVRVDARTHIDGVVLRVHDSGIGMSTARLAQANAKLASRPSLSSAAAGTMGLYVVAHLAARHRIRVELHGTGSGTVAYVWLPQSVLAPWTTIRMLPMAEVDPTLGSALSRPYLTKPSRKPPPPPAATPRRQRVAPPATVVAALRPALTSMPSHASPQPQPVVPTTGGAPLPRRRPGALLVESPRGTTEPPDRDLLDPETVRARLSALSEGVSAALRRTRTPPPPIAKPGNTSPNGAQNGAAKNG
jgi:hypothetical protein